MSLYLPPALVLCSIPNPVSSLPLHQEILLLSGFWVDLTNETHQQETGGQEEKEVQGIYPSPPSCLLLNILAGAVPLRPQFPWAAILPPLLAGSASPVSTPYSFRHRSSEAFTLASPWMPHHLSLVLLTQNTAL